eukprot:4495606-Pleurochrysis_carterae.AAC.1
MGRAVDIVEHALESVVEDGQMLLDEESMMGVESQLPPLAVYVKYMYCTKLMELAGSSVSEHHYARLRRELFSPEQEANKETDELCVELAAVAAAALLAELCDPSRATARHLSSAGGELSWNRTTAAVHAAGRGLIANNDQAESSFGAIPQELSNFGRIDFGSTAGMPP